MQISEEVRQGVFMVLNRFLLVSFVLSGFAMAQTTLRVPSGSSNQCDGPNCVNNSQSQDTNNATDEMNDQSVQDQDQSSRYSRSSTQGYATRNTDQNGRYNRSTQDIPTYRIPGDRSDDLQRNSEDEFPTNTNEPLDFSLTYPPR